MGRDDIYPVRILLQYVIAYLGYDIVQWQPTLDILTGYISSRLMTCTSGCYYSF